MKCNSDKTNYWQKALIEAVTDPEELIELLELDKNLLPAAKKAAITFPLKVPRSFISRINKGDIHDPLLRQVLPLQEELDDTEGYSFDPLKEAQFNPMPGLLHKYQGRILLTPSGTCGVNCRYCFRRYFNYEENNPGSQGLQKAFDYIKQDSSIIEVILSGGDPLVIADQTLKNLSHQLTTIPHIKRLRLHSRMPIVIPERITTDFIDACTSTRFKTILVVHCNHANEINEDVRIAMQSLTKANIVLLNQTVLLKGVNDNVETLTALSEALFDAGIQPYYLHALDKVQGAAHFDHDLATAKELHWSLSKRLSGYLVPKLVYEQPGAPAKMPLENVQNFEEFCTD